MTRIYATEHGILQQKESGRTILVTKRTTIEVNKLKRKITSQEIAEEIAEALIRQEKRFSDM